MTRTREDYARALVDAARPLAPVVPELGRPALLSEEVGLLDQIADLWARRAVVESPPHLHNLPPAIAMIDTALLVVACPENSAADLAHWVEPVRNACVRFDINTFRRVAAFLANTAHESSGFTKLEENLNYSAQRMAEVWPRRFAVDPGAKVKAPNALARSLHRQPEAFANHVYANRMGNGPPESGDGWRYRGGGLIGLTGANNWRAFAKDMAMAVDAALTWVRTMREGAVMAAAWFWEENDINRLADTPGVNDEAKAINGGTIGLADRKRRFDALIEAMLKREREAA